MWASGQVQYENFWAAEHQILTCVMERGILRRINAGSLERCSSYVTEQFPYKAHKTIPFPVDGSTEPGGGVQPLRSATGGFRVLQQRDWSEHRSLWLVVRVRAADLSWEWRAANSLQLCEQDGQPVSTCMMSQVLGFSWRLRGGHCSGGKLRCFTEFR